MKQEDIIDFARKRFVETPREDFLGELVKHYEQVHLAVARRGTDYRDKARIEIARQAILYNCEWAVDGDYCQENSKGKSVILAATGLRKKDNKGIIKSVFPKTIISHISDLEFLGRMEENPENYDALDLTTECRGGKYIEQAELRLARLAGRNKCSWVTQMDYVFHSPRKRYVKIEAKGLIRK